MIPIEIPFRADMREAIIAGNKYCTSRSKKYGRPGDTFKIGAKTYVLTAVLRRSLGTVASMYYEAEGTDSPDAFRSLWAEIHPRKGFDPCQMVWVHHFREVL